MRYQVIHTLSLTLELLCLGEFLTVRRQNFFYPRFYKLARLFVVDLGGELISTDRTLKVARDPGACSVRARLGAARGDNSGTA